ncbi:MAG: alpha/beta fold hydrolase [Clostridia bacterium]|nr:alpha/beta fold hydrolase [Clostridia bacterium]
MKPQAIVIGQGTNYPLNGLLTLPEDLSRPVPAVVFVHGSGSSNMDEKVKKLTPFKDLAEGLAAHGIASIRYDKRSFAHPLKLLRDKSRPLTVKEETIEDALLATELLKADTRIDRENVFIIGHSMGGMLAPRIDAEGGHYRGLVLLAGTPRKLENVMLEQNAQLAAELPLLRPLLNRQTAKLEKTFAGMYELTDEEAQKRKVAGGTTVYYFKEMGERPAEQYLLNTDKPLLILQGEKDVQVRPDVDFSAYQELLKDRHNVTFKLYEGLNHAFVPAVCGKISKVMKEFSKEQHIGETVIADIAGWIRENCR